VIAGARDGIGLCARVSSHGQRAGLDRQVACQTARAAQSGGAVVRAGAEVGSGMNEACSKARRLLACETVRQVWPSLVKGYTHLVCGPCSTAGKQPDVPIRLGMVLVHTFNVAGFFGGYTCRIAAAEERASIVRAAALVRAAFLNALGEPGPDG